MSMIRSRWAAVGAAVAVTLGAGGIGFVSATSPSDAATFVPITPCRVIDTRPDFQVGPRSTPLGADETYDVTTTGTAGECTTVPTTATGVVLNVTATDATAPTFLTIWNTDEVQPNASSLNPTPGEPPVPNAVTTGINASGQFSIYNLAGTVHVLADIVGYYTDHHHDDRYYTETETDDRFYTKEQSDARYGPAAYGNIRSSGSIRAGSENIVEVVHPSTGEYCVVFSDAIDPDRLESAVISGAGSSPVLGFGGNGVGALGPCQDVTTGMSRLEVYINTADGTENGVPNDRRFTFIVP